MIARKRRRLGGPAKARSSGGAAGVPSLSLAELKRPAPVTALVEEDLMSFTLPELPSPHDALAPYMSRETLEYHHDKHHLAYVNNGNNLLNGSGLEGKSLEEIVKGSFGKNAGLFNNAGQHYNHMHFWKWMKPKGGGKIPGELEKRIVADLGSVEKMKEDFVQAGVTQFGSGWGWLRAHVARAP